MTPVRLTVGAVSPEPLGAGMFGANTVFPYMDSLEQSGSAAGYGQIGVGLLRYPGGTVTERFFDIRNPDADIAGLSGAHTLNQQEFLSYCGASGTEALTVLPSVDLPDHHPFDGVEEGDFRMGDWIGATPAPGAPPGDGIYGYVYRSMEAAEAHGAVLRGFEIGNEFWINDGISAAEYGDKAGRILVLADAAIRDFRADHPGPTPLLAIQVGDDAAENAAARAAFAGNPAALEILRTGDGVALTSHYYFGGDAGWPDLAPDEVTNPRLHDADLWPEMQAWEALAGRSLDRVISEWGVVSPAQWATPEAAYTGLRGADPVVYMLSHFALNGVEVASTWPSLKAGAWDGLFDWGGALTTRGQIFALLHDQLAGHQAVEMTGATRAVNGFSTRDDSGFGAYGFVAGDQARLVLSSFQDAPQDLSLGADLLGTALRGGAVYGVGDQPVSATHVPLVSRAVAPGQALHLEGREFAILDLNLRQRGGAGADLLRGTPFGDRLEGGAGADRLHGGGGLPDTFVFGDPSDSPPGAGDVITDFRPGLDKIDLRAMDADTGRAGDQGFTFTGSQPGAHAVWVVDLVGACVIRGDVTGDGVADFEIHLSGTGAPGATDFWL